MSNLLKQQMEKVTIDDHKLKQAKADWAELYIPKDVIKKVSNLITKDWKKLSDCLNLKKPLVSMHRSYEQNMIICFQKVNVSWPALKKGLRKINRHDILIEISQMGYNTEEKPLHEYKDAYQWYSIHSNGSIEISEVNQLTNMDEPIMISYLSSGHGQTRITLNDWIDRCNIYYNKYFEHENKILFPPQVVRKTNLFKIAEFFLDNIDVDDGKLHIFMEYDIVEHLKFYLGNNRCKYEEVLQKLLITNQKDLECFKNRILIFDSNTNSVIIVRVTEEIDSNSVLEEDRKGQNDLKILLFINKHCFLSDSEVHLYNIVVAPNFTGSRLSADVIDQQMFERGNVRYWWNSNTSKCSGNNISESMVKGVFGFMGTRLSTVNEYGPFPSFDENEVTVHTQLLRLILTNEQSKAKKILFGGYGVGKSLVGQYQAEVLAKQEAGTENPIFYVCWDERSLFYLEMKQFIESIRISTHKKQLYVLNRTELASGYLGLSKMPSISSMLAQLKEHWESNTIHVIIDEFDMDCLTLVECWNLNKLFQLDGFKRSLILFIAQTMEREYVTTGIKTQKDVYKYIEMSSIHLTKHMRSTLSNFEFTEIATDIVSDQVQNFIPHSPDRSDADNINQKEKSVKQNKDVGMIKVNMDTKDVECDISKRGNNLNLGSSLELDLQPKGEQEILFQMPVSLDEFNFPANSSHLSSAIKETVTTYSCKRSSKLGHNINGTVPIFLCFDKEYDYIDRIAKLSFVLEKLVFTKNCKKLFLSKPSEDYEEYALPVLLLNTLGESYMNYSILSDHKLIDGNGIVYDHLPDTYNIITDYRGARGLEAENVIIFIDSDRNEQTFVESASRCTSNLYIVYPHSFNPDDPMLMPPVVYQIIKESILKHNITEYVIEASEGHSVEDVITIVDHSEMKKYFLISSDTWEYRERCKIVKNLPLVEYVYHSQTFPFDSPEDLRCVYDYQDIHQQSCFLVWKDNPFDFIVKKKAIDAASWQFISKRFSNSQYSFWGLKEGKDYAFSVMNVSMLGESIEANILWRHINLFRCIISDKFEEIKETIDLFPGRRHDKRSDDYTLYHLAAVCNRPQILHFLLEVDASHINDFDVDNDTPLHHASTFDSVECIDILLYYHANWKIKNKDGYTAYDKARHKVTKDIFKKYIKEYQQN